MAADLLTYVRSTRREGLGTRVRVACPDGGTASIARYDLCPGVLLLGLDFRTRRCGAVRELEGLAGDVHVVHCQRGSIQAPDDAVAPLLAGQVGVVRQGIADAGASFPEGLFRGLAVVIDRSAVDAEVVHAAGVLGLDVECLFARMEREGGAARVMSRASLAHVFAEIYDILPPSDLGIVRVKVLEMLLMLQRELGAGRAEGAGDDGRPEPAPELMGKRMALAYRAQDLLTRDLSRTYTIPQLAELCDTSPTVLKSAFREAFGMPVYSWYRAYRIRRACELLRERPGDSIAQVAAEVGYSNPSKFSHAFAQVMGMAPYAWRNASGS